MTVFDTLLYHLPQPWVYYLQGVSFDLMHSIGNVVFFLVFLPVVKRSCNVIVAFCDVFTSSFWLEVDGVLVVLQLVNMSTLTLIASRL